MLVLSRKKGESIMIGDDIELVVVEIKGDQVRLGVKAPKDVSIYRHEVFHAISEANQEASLVSVKPDEVSKMFKSKKNDEIDGGQ
ncbi:MAG: carbon storage regulator CsrA [Paenibacillaceae bacterium]